MSHFINYTAEKTARSLINVFYYIVLALCIIGNFIGIILLFVEFTAGIYTIIIAGFYLLHAILIKALCDVFINISIKLDDGHLIYQELQTINKTINKLSQNSNQANNTPSSSSNCCATTKLAQQESHKTNIDTNDLDTDIDNIILGEIVSGNEDKALLILTQNTNLSQEEALAHIEHLKKMIK